MCDVMRCAHCGEDFKRSTGRGRPRRWCFACLPAFNENDPGDYFRLAARLANYAKTGRHGSCCGIPRFDLPRKPRARQIVTVLPIECLYCETPVNRDHPGKASLACSEHAAAHQKVMAKAYRQSPLGRAKRYEARDKRRHKDRLLIIIRLMERDGTRCALCGFPTQMDGSDPTEVDHVIPIALGGSNDLTNLQLAHSSCNRAKGKRIA